MSTLSSFKVLTEPNNLWKLMDKAVRRLVDDVINVSNIIGDVIDDEINFIDDSVNFIDDGVDDKMCHFLEAFNVDDVEKFCRITKKIDIDIKALEFMDTTAIEN